jgi:phospholipid transport system substrate-binding protein
MVLLRLIRIKPIKIFIVFAVIFMIATPSRSNDVKLAETFIENLGLEIIKLVDSNSTVNEKQTWLLDLFYKNASVMTISRAALGSKWRNLDAETRLDFSNAFTNYIVKKYGKQFEEFSGSTLVIERSLDAGKRGILVNTRLIMPGTSPISIKWQVWQKSNSFKLIDIIIEDISMLTMEREEIKNRLSTHKGSIEYLINELQEP